MPLSQRVLLEASDTQTVRGQPAPTIGLACLKACQHASQPPDHDSCDVGICAHHCGDHGSIENGHGCITLRSDRSARELCRALFKCAWIECDDMELSLPPCCRGLPCRTISNSPDRNKVRKARAPCSTSVEGQSRASERASRAPAVERGLKGSAAIRSSTRQLAGRAVAAGRAFGSYRNSSRPRWRRWRGDTRICILTIRRTQPQCQGWGRGFKSHRPLQFFCKDSHSGFGGRTAYPRAGDELKIDLATLQGLTRLRDPGRSRRGRRLRHRSPPPPYALLLAALRRHYPRYLCRLLALPL